MSFPGSAEAISFVWRPGQTLSGEHMLYIVGACGPAGEGGSSGVTGLWSPRLTARDKMERRGEQRAGSCLGPCSVLGLCLCRRQNRRGAVSKGVTGSSFWLRKIILSGKKSNPKGDCQPHGVRAPPALHTKQNSVDVCSNHISQAYVGQRKEKSPTYG